MSSCMFRYHPTTVGRTFSPVEPEQIKLYAGDIADDYQVVGVVCATATGIDFATQHLVKKAAALGANAIINVELDKIASFTTATGISGVAIRVE